MKGQKKSGLVVIGVLIVFFAAVGTMSAQNIVKNGSFEKPPVTTPNGGPYNETNQNWNAYVTGFADLDWIVEWRQDVYNWIRDNITPQGQPVQAALLELQRNGVWGSDPKTFADDGIQWAELDSDWTGPFTGFPPNPPYRATNPGDTIKPDSVSIHQHLDTLPGTYTLSFAFSPRPLAGDYFSGQPQNKLEVRWNGQPLMFSGSPYLIAFPPAGVALDWKTYTVDLQATGLTSELRFTDLGYADSYGTYLDSVVVTRTGDGCTKTQGYWKTHSKYGPASYDATWALVKPNGEDSPFFNTPYTWYAILHLAPRGDAYLILAHQYIAAYLNLLAGASAWKNVSYDDLYNAMTTAETLLGLSMNVPKSQRQQYIEIAEFLTKYNEGLIGPGHCFEESDEPMGSKTK